MRGYETTIVEAELLASSPESVHKYLKARAAKSEDDLRDDAIDQETEEALRLRRDPLIDLSIAMHARYVSAVKPLFTSGKQGGAIRLAILSNRALGKGFLSGFPLGLFDDADEIKAWLTDAPSDEMGALFQNPTIDQAFLGDLLEGKPAWANIPSNRLGLVVALLANNDRMSALKDFDDGWAYHMYHRVFDQAWALAEGVETSDEWAKALSGLFNRLSRHSYSMKEPLEVAKRWHPTPEVQATMEADYRGGSASYLSSYELVRQGLAQLALSNSSRLLPEFIESEDRAIRAAAYADGSLTIEQLDAAYVKDGEMAYNQAVINRHLWRLRPSREALRQIARQVSQDDKSGDRMSISLFDKVSKSMAMTNPEWFKDDERDNFSGDEIEEHDKPATKGDLDALAKHFAQQKPASDLEAINKHVNWLVLMCGFLVAVVIFKLW
jgi:hypothetical protein